ncbi:MAG TPA: transcriptional regulator [Clostridiaceae bacterium]|nr:transcriptional regulator [Clostridiaceae bacterium]
MNIPILDLKRQYTNLKDEIGQAIQGVLESTQFILGPNLKELENKIAAYCNVRYGIGVANGTDALELTLKALNIGEGDEVITTPFTFIASAEVASKVGAKPVFADIDPDTYLIDVDKIEEKITERTKAIIPVHIFGQMCDMDKMMKIAEKHNLYIIEDSCQAIGSEYKGKKSSSFGIAGCFSFYPTKNLGGYGDGGMIVTDDEELAAKLKILRAHGSNPKYYHSMFGYNSRLDELQAAILNVKFKYLDEWNRRRREIAHRYNEKLKVKVPKEATYGQYHTYHQYTIEVDDRKQFEDYMKANGIGTCIYYPVPLHLQEVYKSLGYKKGDFPNTEKACERVISIPISPEMTAAEQEHVIATINNFFK